jgi:hypothetical protein
MVDWAEVQKALFPIHSYEDLCRHFRVGFSYGFVRRCFNFALPDLKTFITRMLGEDTRQRYGKYLAFLTRVLDALQAAGVADILDLTERTNSAEKLELFQAETGLAAPDVVGVLKFLVYWVVPAQKSLRELAKKGSGYDAEFEALRQAGIRCNLDLIERGQTPAARRELAQTCGIPEAAVTELVHRADFSRLPWSSTATINNLVGAGYGGLDRLVAAEIEQVSADFYRYGQAIGKNLKYGNEIDNSHRIAKLVPKVVN